MLLLHGTVSSDCDWLVLGERAGPSLKMFQTRSEHTLPVHVVGNKLRAGSKPMQGDIAIETNGGSLTIPVRAEVPVRPFPKGNYANNVLAGEVAANLPLRRKSIPMRRPSCSSRRP